MGIAVGVDLGTTNTVVAAVVDGVAVTLEDEQQRRLLPSVVSFHPSGTVLVGDAARERRLIDPENTIFSIKPLIGRTFDSEEVQNARTRFPFRLVEGAKSSTMVMARDVGYALPEISAFVLRRAKAIAERALGEPVDRAVITVPANFNDLQRASTKIAGKLAGLEVMRILNEPTAAALAYGQSIAKAEKIAVYDLGGGTFDITLLDLTGNVFEVLATAGDTALGGDDIDALVADQLALEVVRRFNYDPRTNPVALGRLRFVAEEMKKELSDRTTVERELTGIGYGEGGEPIVARVTLTRERLDALVRPLVERTVSVVQQSIEIIGLHPKDFDRVLLVGGSTRMPLVARAVEQLFARPPHLRVNPDEVVALGAAIQAHALNRSRASARKANAPPAPAKAPPVPQRPPPPKQAAAPPPVPRAPRVPAGASPLEVPTPSVDLPSFEFSKARAVITFSPPAADGAHPTPPETPAVRPSRPIDGSPARPDHAGPPSSGPKPARTSGAPSPPVMPASRPPGALPASGAYRATPEPRTRPSAPAIDASADEPAFALVAPPPPDLDLPRSQPGHGAQDVELELPPNAGPIELDRGEEQAAPAPEAFARGSAIATAEEAPLLIDVTPLSLRVETVGGYSDVLIAANAPVPCEKARTFLTASDRQTTVFVRVAQGESARFAENTYLGELELSGLRPAPRGAVKILVTFELDADGILAVSAKDKETGRETNATMRLLGTHTDARDVAAMAARQARHVVA